METQAMFTAADVSALIASRDAFVHVRASDPSARYPVVKLLPQRTGGVDVLTPDGKRRHGDKPETVVALVAAAIGKSARCAVTFRTRHLGGLHVFFTTDEHQCLVVWRTRDPDTNEIVTVSSTVWAAAAEGEIEGYDLSERQRDWLIMQVAAANLWTEEMTKLGLNGNEGGAPTKPIRLYVPVRTKRGQRLVRF